MQFAILVLVIWFEGYVLRTCRSCTVAPVVLSAVYFIHFNYFKAIQNFARTGRHNVVYYEKLPLLKTQCPIYCKYVEQCLGLIFEEPTVFKTYNWVNRKETGDFAFYFVTIFWTAYDSVISFFFLSVISFHF